MTWHLELNCPSCGGPLSKINGTCNGSLTVAIVVCEQERKQFEINVRIRPMAWTSEELNQQVKDRARLREAS